MLVKNMVLPQVDQDKSLGLTLDDVKKAIKINGVTNLVVNIRLTYWSKLKSFKLIDNGNLLTFNEKRLFKGFIVQELS